MTYKWPLQRNIITKDDRLKMIEFISNADNFTSGDNVKLFESKWSNWLNVNGKSHKKSKSIFLQSGSAANLLLFSALIDAGYLSPGDRVAIPKITWATTLTPLYLFDLKPVWIDIDQETLTMNLDQLKNKDYDFIWITHLAGLSNPMNEIVNISIEKGVNLAEDCCQSYGALCNNEKVGTFGLASTFSFYYGHHMTTIEGGMLSFNVPLASQSLINAAEASRSHGLTRKITDKASRNKIYGENSWIDKRFLFSSTPFNFRSTEINAVLGLNQLRFLDRICAQRAENFYHFCDTINTWYKMKKRLIPVREISGTKNSSFCLPFVFKNKDDKSRFIHACENKRLIETRPLAGGVIAHQPAFIKTYYDEDFSFARSIYERTVYIGNNHMIKSKDWQILHEVWDEAF